jgi:hypothetical protein
VVPGLAQGDGALTASERTRLAASVRTLLAARHEDASLVDVGFPEARWQELRVAMAEHGRRVCRTAHRLPVVLQLRTPAGEHLQREASLWRAEGQDRLSLEVEPPRQAR